MAKATVQRGKPLNSGGALISGPRNVALEGQRQSETEHGQRREGEIHHADDL